MSHLSRFVTVWSALQAQVAAGRLPGFAAAVRYRGQVEVRTGGCLTRGGPDAVASNPVAQDAVAPETLFRIASLSKPYAGALTLALVADGLLALDDPVARWLPELAEPRVLARRGAQLDDTIPVERPITVRHLLTNTPGFGGLWDSSPLADAIDARGVGPGPLPPELTPEEFLGRLGELPLAAQPGERWLYHISADVLSVLLVRVTGRPLGALLAERVTGPLGLHDTAFWARDDRRLATGYVPDGDRLTVLDPAGRSTRPPLFEGLGGGLVATAPDVLGFLATLADGGGSVLPPGSVAQMTTDALTAEQRADAAMMLGARLSWGFQVGLDLVPALEGATPGRWGWNGGTGTSGWVDPGRDLVAVLLTNRGMAGPNDGPEEFWRALYRCL